MMLASSVRARKLLLPAFLCLFLVQGVPLAQAFESLATEPIPEGYETYSLFLVPSSEWVDRPRELERLKAAFKAFGDSIGDRHLAAWFFDPEGLIDRTIGVSIDRSKRYCDAFHLNYNDGPYVVVTRFNPDKEDDPDPIVIKLYRIQTPGVIRILNILEQDLRTRKTGLSRTALLWEEMKQRVVSYSDLITAVIDWYR